MAKPPMEPPGRGERAGEYSRKPRWIAHNQNCMPARLKPDTLVRLRMKRVEQIVDEQTSCEAAASWWNWSEGSIIAYQIVE